MLWKKILTKDTCAKFVLVLMMIIAKSFFGIYPIMLIQKIVDLAVSDQFNSDQIISAGALYLIAQISGKIATSAVKYMETAMQSELAYQTQIELFESLSKTKIYCITKLDHADISSTLIRDTEYIGNNIVAPYSETASAILTFLFGFYFMARINMRLTLIILPLGVVSSIVIKKIRRDTMDNLSNQRERAAKLLNTFSEGIWGFIPIYIHGYFGEYLKKVKMDGYELVSARNQQGKLESISLLITSTSFMTTIGLILIFSALFVNSGMVSVGGLTALMMYNHMLTDPLINLLQIAQKISQLKVSEKRVRKIFDLPKEEKTFANIDQIELQNVGLSYGATQVFKNFSLSLSFPVSVGIYGKTGSGKSTLSKVIAGILEPTSGSINYLYKNKVLDNKPLVSYMAQNDYIFNMSILENIKIGNISITDEEINEIIEVCDLKDIINQHGENALGTGGETLSGGEKKRILIARTIANKKANLYVFDEISASLDDKTFLKIFVNLERFLSHKMRIYVEHNKKVKQYFDRVVVMDDITL